MSINLIWKLCLMKVGKCLITVYENASNPVSGIDLI